MKNLTKFIIDQSIFLVLGIVSIIGLYIISGPVFTLISSILIIIPPFAYLCRRTLLLPLDLILGKVTQTAYFRDQWLPEDLDFFKNMYCRQWKFQLKNKNGQNGQALWLLAPIVFTAEDVDKIVPPPKDVLLRLRYFRFSKILLEWSMDMDNEKNGNTTKSSLSNGLMTDISLATGRPGDKLLRAIVNDVAKSAPRSALSSLEKLVEYSDQFSTLDGLIRAYFNPTIEKNKVSQKTMYLISITTIWIALFTRPIDSAKLQADRLIKAKRELQICMLYYCFGLLTGTIQDDEWCIKLANALMAHFGLEYAPADKLV